MTKTIVITSGKGGVGKTNISVNTALELSLRNYSTCLFDADLGLANVNILLGITPETTIDDCLFGNKKIEDVLLHTKFGLDIISGSSGIEKMANLDSQSISQLITSFSQLDSYDYFLIDTSSGISKGVIAFCLASNETIIVITSEFTSLTDAYSLLKVLALNNYEGKIKVVVNKCANIEKSKETYLRYKGVADKYLDIDMSLAGVVLTDPNIELAVAGQKPVLSLYPNSIASQCIRAMVSNLLKNGSSNEGENFTDFWKRYFDLCQDNLKLPDMHNISEDPLPPLPEQKENYNLNKENSSPSESFKDTISPFPQTNGIIDIKDLICPTPLLQEFMKLQSKGQVTRERLIDLFRLEPTLLLKLLRLQSSSTPQNKRITSLGQLFTGVGTETLTHILTTASLQSTFFPKNGGDTLFPTRFWYHSLRCALLSKRIAEETKYSYPDEAYLAGLFHDIGRLALQTEYPEAYSQITHGFEHKHLLEQEKEIFGKNHAEIGAKALRAWNINSFLADAICYHTEEESRVATAFDLVKIVYIATHLALPTEDTDPSTSAAIASSLFDITPPQINSILREVNTQFQETINQLGIPTLENIDMAWEEETYGVLKQLVLDYSLLQGIMPNPAQKREFPEVIHLIHQGLEILFGIKKAICLLPDSQRKSLRATGTPACYGCDTYSDIHISLDSTKSLIVEAFKTGEIQLGLNDIANNIQSLADEQLMRAMSSHGLVCIPMTAQDETKGVILIGIQNKEISRMKKLQEKLEQFGTQSAMNISLLETPTKEKDAQGNIFQFQEVPSR